MYREEDNIIRTVDEIEDQVELGGLGQFYFKYMKEHGEKTAQIDLITGETDTYQSLLKKCIRASIALSKRGIAKGDLIAYYSGVHINSCVPVITSYFIGAILSFLDISLPPSEISYLLKQVKPKLLLTDPQNFEKIKQIIKNIELDTKIVIFYDEFFKHQDEEDSFKPIYVDNLKETAAIYFSSGSTGYPKGICLNHYSMLCWNLPDWAWKGENKVVLGYDSLYWTSQSVRLVAATRIGACNIIGDVERFDPSEFWNVIETHKVNIVFMVPACISMLCELGRPKTNTSSLTTFISEGYRLYETYKKGLQEMLPDTYILQPYGMTEVGLLTAFSGSKIHQEYNTTKLGSVGVPIEGYGICYRVVDLKTGENLGPNKFGELRVKSKMIMNGYYNQDSSNEFDKDGWFKTGDIVYYDKDFCFFVVDRIKHVLIYVDWHIVPAFIEDELLTHPAIKQAVVIAIPHDVDGDHPLAVVTLNKGYENTTPSEIEEYVKGRLSEIQQLRGGVRIVDQIPLTTTGKVKRQELKKMILSLM